MKPRPEPDLAAFSLHGLFQLLSPVEGFHKAM